MNRRRESVGRGITRSTGNGDVAVGAWISPTGLGRRVRRRLGPGRSTSLINNAGVMAVPELTLTPRGEECSSRPIISATSSSASGLHDALPRAPGSAARRRLLPSRTSVRPVLFDDPGSIAPYPRRRPTPVKDGQRPVRGRSRPSLGADGITANAVKPGGMATGLQRHFDPEAMDRARPKRARAPSSRPSSRAPRRRSSRPSRRCRRRRRPLPRGLQRGRDRQLKGRLGRPPRRRPVRARPGQRRAAVGDVRAARVFAGRS